MDGSVDGDSHFMEPLDLFEQNVELRFEIVHQVVGVIGRLNEIPENPVNPAILSQTTYFRIAGFTGI